MSDLAHTGKPAHIPEAGPSMNDRHTLRVPGIAGVLTAVVSTIVGVLYFIYAPGPPSVWDVFTRDLLNLVSVVLFLIFAAGLTHLLRRAGAADDWVNTLGYSAAVMYAVIVLVATSLEAGVIFGNSSGAVDPTTTGTLAQGDILMHGSIPRLLTAVFLAAAGTTILRTRALPSWAGWAAYAIAAINLVFVPSIYFGTSSAQFYSALGWGNSALTDSFVIYWALAVSIVMLGRLRTEPPLAPR